MSIVQLEPYRKDNPLLKIIDEEEMLGFKHVYQTRVTKDTVNSRIRAAMGMWSIAETFIDNDATLLMKRWECREGECNARTDRWITSE